jgi:hypothetical protein
LRAVPFFPHDLSPGGLAHLYHCYPYMYMYACKGFSRKNPHPPPLDGNQKATPTTPGCQKKNHATGPGFKKILDATGPGFKNFLDATGPGFQFFLDATGPGFQFVLPQAPDPLHPGPPSNPGYN